VGDVLRLPIKHGEGCYYAPEETLRRLEDQGQVVVRYCEPDGTVSERANPNGSVGSVAGITNEAGNVFGLMPHPEHAVEEAIGGTDGRILLGSLLDFVRGARP
jgi:phosphoribosylformylglycinamidine (FGAM) synthase-like amidotransferase family enzyme